MADSFRTVSPGENLQIPAVAWNALMRMLGEHGSSGGAAGRDIRPGIVLVKNAAATARAQFEALGIDSPIVTPSASLSEFKQKVALSCVATVAATHVGKFAVMQEPIAAGELGRAIIAGPTIAQVNVTDAGHEFADAGDSSTVLVSATEGAARILWKESGTGTKWAVINIGGSGAAADSTIILVKLTSNATGTGKYNGTEFLPPSADVSASTDLAEAQIGTVTGGRTCLVCNPAEIGNPSGSHILEVPNGLMLGLCKIVWTNSGGTLVCVLYEAFCLGSAKGQVVQMMTDGSWGWGKPKYTA